MTDEQRETAITTGQTAGRAAKHGDWALVQHQSEWFSRFKATIPAESVRRDLQTLYDDAYRTAARRGMGMAL